MVSKTRKSTPKGSRLKKKIIAVSILLAVLVVIVYLALNYERFFVGKPVATVNREVITDKELAKAYARLPDQYKLVVTKFDLLDQMVNEKLLLQESVLQRISVSNEEVDAALNMFINESGLTSEEFDLQLKQQKITIDDLKEFYKKSLAISKLLNQTIDPKINITVKEIDFFYANNKDIILAQNPDIKLEDMKAKIREYLYAERQAELLETYLKDLRKKSEIKIEINKFNTFRETKDPICKDFDEKPIIRLFVTSDCKSCKWIMNAFNIVSLDYINKGQIVAHQWVLDTGDDLLTEEVETSIPKSELEVFKKYNQKSTVPTFIFGCKYARIGNAYEKDNDLNSEKEEFKAVISDLISSK